jgi:hypothetical protein
MRFVEVIRKDMKMGLSSRRRELYGFPNLVRGKEMQCIAITLYQHVPCSGGDLNGKRYDGRLQGNTCKRTTSDTPHFCSIVACDHCDSLEGDTW